MIARDVLEQARESLAAHRLRAGLSALGIVCGVAAIVAAFAIGEGARRRAFEELGTLGLDNVYLRVEMPAAVDRRAAPVPDLTEADVMSAAARTGAVMSAATARTAPVEYRYESRTARGQLSGVSAGWSSLTGACIIRGRALTQDDVETARRVIVIGEPIARSLFGDRPPLGRYVRAADGWYRVAGVMKGQGDVGLVPAATMAAVRGPGDSVRHISEAVFRVHAGIDVARTAALLDARLRERYRGSGMAIVVPRALLDARLRAERSTHALLLGVGGLALVIGGIGIMNIMLASVAERTHEIGVRRAFGATRAQIVRQFTLEAALLCAAGGAAGFPAGALLAWIVARLGGWPIVISPWSALAAITLACLVGLGAGIYPARRAAALDPAAALRAE